MKINLLKLSNSLHNDADILLERTKLIKKLSAYGEVSIGGSYDLMILMVIYITTGQNAGTKDFLKVIISG